MITLRVWAPNAEMMETCSGDDRLPMEAQDGGWWKLDLDDSHAGVDYGFSIDGADPLPDPRSSWQPEGVRGPSRMVDSTSFQWRVPDFTAKLLRNAVIYELHVGTFTPEGTFRAIQAKLDHLVELGVTHIELMPVCEFSGTRGWGYDGVFLYAPHHQYGAPDDLRRMVDACHEKGIAVILDVVYNHLGPDGNVLEHYGPYFTESYHTPWGKAVNLDDAGSDEVRRFFLDSALMWLREFHIDGLRLDAVHSIYDFSAFHFLEQLSSEVETVSAQLGRQLVLVAESDLNDPRIVWSRERGGYEMDAVWSDDFHHAIHAVLTGEHAGYYEDYGAIADLAKALTDVYVYDGAYSKVRDRQHGRPVGDVARSKFIIATQNHDQVGNRAQGDRLVHLAGMASAKQAAALLFVSPEIPMLFQGEEWAASSPFQYFTDYADEGLGKAVTEGRRKEFGELIDAAHSSASCRNLEAVSAARLVHQEVGPGDHREMLQSRTTPADVPDPQDPETYKNSQLRWDDLDAPEHADMLLWYQSLIRLRREEMDLRNPAAPVSVLFDESQRWLVFYRGDIATALNFGDVEVLAPLSAKDPQQLMVSGETKLLPGSILLSPHSVAVIRAGNGER